MEKVHLKTGNHYFGIDVLKAGAALLIINSHLESFYPRPWMSVDGMLGNSLFFFITGFVLANSIEKRPSESIWRFCWNRLSRLYPAAWIVLILLPPVTSDWTSSTGSAFKWLIYGTPFTFIRTILPLYPLFFIIIKSIINDRLLFLFGLALSLLSFGLALPHIWEISNGGVHWSDLGLWAWQLHFSACMIFGGWLRKHDMGSSPQRLICAASQWLAVVIVYMASRIIALPAIAPKLSALLPLVLLAPPGCILFAVSSLRLIQTPAVASFLESKVCYTIITFLAVHSWETYLLHSGISHWPMVAHLPSPLALLAVFALTFALAPVLRFVSNLSNFRSKKKI